jgi:hypothetical protein
MIRGHAEALLKAEISEICIAFLRQLAAISDSQGKRSAPGIRCVAVSAVVW